MLVQKTNEDGILTEALLLLRSQGYQRTTMSDVGKACGLLKGSLYHYFSSKEEMAQAVLGQVDRHFQDSVFPIAKDKGLTPSQRLSALADITLDYFIDRNDGCLMGNIALEAINTTPAFRPIIKRYFGDWMNTYEDVYLDLGLSKHDAKCKAQEAVARIQGALMMVRIFEDSDYFRRCMNELSLPPYVQNTTG